MEKDKNERGKKEKEKRDYEEGLKKTVTPFLFGVLAGIICFSILVASPLLTVTENGMTKNSLDRGVVPANLLEMLATKGLPVTENATVNKNAGTDKWLINNAGGENICIITEDTKTLKVYTNLKSSDWLFIAILIVMTQKFAYPFMHTKIEGVKDWFYIAFMTLCSWFIAFTLLLSLAF